jgi:hypothetical protein
MARSGSSTSSAWSLSRPPGQRPRPDWPHKPCREACRNAKCGKSARYVVRPDEGWHVQWEIDPPRQESEAL